MTLRKVQGYLRKHGEDRFLKEICDIEEDDTSFEDRKEIDSYVLYSTPKYLNAVLRSYQLEGLNWLINMHEHEINCILADEMGLGKTIQSIALIGYARYVRGEKGRNLVVVPKSVLSNWSKEFEKFCPRLRLKVLWCSKIDLKREGRKIQKRKYDVIVTTYEMCLLARKKLKGIKFNYLVVDEAQRLKNEMSALSTTLRSIHFKHILLLSGTPLQNNLHELWALLNFIEPEVFWNSEHFETYVMEADKKSKAEKIENIRKLLGLFFLRREKKDVEKSIPPKMYNNIYVVLTAMQKEWYKGILKRDLRNVYDHNSLSSKAGLLNVVMQLRKCCNHPYLFEGAEKEPFEIGEHIVANSGKMMVLDKMLSNFFKKKRRVLIFSTMAFMLDILEDYMNYRGYLYCRIDGTKGNDERKNAVEEFNKSDSDKFVFLLTTRAGGLGINLYTADTVILYDSDWNPYADEQAQDRAHRIGQTKQVQVFRLITENTVEESIQIKALQKLKLDDILMQRESKTKKLGVSRQDLLHVLSEGIEGVENVEKTTEQNMLSIEEIIARGEKKTAEMNEKIKDYKIGEFEKAETSYNRWVGRDTSENVIEKYIKDQIDGEEQEERTGYFLLTNRARLAQYRRFEFPDYQFCPKEFYELQDREEALLKKGQSLTEEEENDKREKAAEAFQWTKKDYKKFIGGIENYGKDKVMLRSLFPEKDDFSDYYETFFERMEELEDSKKIETALANLEAKKKRIERIKEMLTQIPEDAIESIYKGRSKFFYNNQALLRLYRKHIDDADCWVKIKAEMFSVPSFYWDFAIHTRSVLEISRYINGLVVALEKFYTEKKAS